MILKISEQEIEDRLRKIDIELVELKEIINGSIKTLRIVICDPSGHVSHEHCVKVHSLIKPMLDSIDQGWYLEVWSPGTDRELKTKRDFQIFKGKYVHVFFKDESQRAIAGHLASCSDYKIAISNHNIFTEFERESIKRVKLASEENNVIQLETQDFNQSVEISVGDI